MARVLGLDVETTGLDVANDRIIEMGVVVWDTQENAPLAIYSEFVNPGTPFNNLSQEVQNVTGIQPGWIANYGQELGSVFSKVQAMIDLYEVTHVVAHNGQNYDRPLCLHELDRFGLASHSLHSLPWLDTRLDLPFDPEPSSRKLVHLAAEHDFLNPFKHRAVFDVLTMMKIFACYDFDKILEQATQPWVVLRALVSYDDREKAKAQRFSWENAGDKKFPKWWVKQVRANKAPAEIEASRQAGFSVVQV